MPNWVFNTLTIQGSDEKTISSIKDRLNKPFELEHDNWDTETQSMQKKLVKYDNPVFAFWNIVAPTDLEAYTKQSSVPFSGDDWYSWNNRNWGTKWDVAVADNSQYADTELIEHKAIGDDYWLIYRFNTAWAPPTQALIKLSEIIPNCVITLDWQEEQGFGGEVEFVNGQLTSESSYESICVECDAKDAMEWCDDCESSMCASCKRFEIEVDELCDEHKELV